MNPEDVPVFNSDELPTRDTTTYFRQVPGLLESQNRRYVAAMEDNELHELPRMSQAALKSIYTEQSNTVDHLHRNMYQIDNLAAQRATVESMLVAEQQLLTELEEKREAEIQRIKSVAERAISYSPYAKEEIAAEAHQELEEISINYDGNIADLKIRVKDLSAQLRQFDAIYDPWSEETTWPLAHVVADHDLAGLVNPEPEVTETDPEIEIIVVDELPVDLVGVADYDREFPDTHEYYGHLPKASDTLAKLFMENPGQVFIPEDVCDLIYDPEIFAAMPEAFVTISRASRVHSLLRHDGSNARVRSMLEQEGMRLQYGWRHFLNSATMKAAQRKRRIYRAVPISAGIDPGDTFADETIFVDAISESEQPNPAPVTATFVEQYKGTIAVKEKIKPGEFNKEEVFYLMGSLMNDAVLPSSPHDTTPVGVLRPLFHTKRAPVGLKEHYDRLHQSFTTRRTISEDISTSEIVLEALGVPKWIQ